MDEAAAAKLEQILAELRALRRDFDEFADEMRRGVEPRPTDVLPLEAAARYIGVRAETLRRGLAGTGAIPRYRDRPVQFLRAALDAHKRAAMERERRRLRPRKGPRLVRRGRGR